MTCCSLFLRPFVPAIFAGLFLVHSVHAGAPLSAAVRAPAVQDDVSGFDPEPLAKAFLAEQGLAETVSFQEFLDSPTFGNVTLGSFDLRIPLAIVDEGKNFNRIQEAAQVLIALQQNWYGWIGSEAGEEEDWNVLDKWVKSWSMRKLSKCEGGTESLLVQLGARDKVIEAAKHLAESTHYPDETVRSVGDRNVTILTPSRRSFLEVVSVAGLLDARKRDALWGQGMIRQGAAWVDWMQILALAGPIFPIDKTQPFEGKSMSEEDRSGLAQHVAERGGIISLRKEFIRQGTHFFEEALGTNLVIAATGGNGIYSAEWEITTHTEGASTQAYTRFVPGGNPSGGVLPKRVAQAGPTTTTGTRTDAGLYRSNGGIDYFKDPLRAGQKAGAKLASKAKDKTFPKDKRPYFKLSSQKTGESTYVAVPFLGQPAEGKTLPGNDFLDDYEDFFRAYRSCFIDWLKAHGGDSREESATLFARLVKDHSQRSRRESLDDVVEKTYGTPLSSEDDSTDSLEWRYITWLKKGK